MLNLEHHFARNSETAECAALFCLGCLAPDDREEFHRHLLTCDVCREEVERYADLLAKWASSSNAQLPEGARERFLSKLRFQTDPPTSGSVLLNRDGLLITRPAAMEWEPGPIPGISLKTLSADPVRKYGTSLVRLAKGTRYPRHRHRDVEEVYLLAGDFQIEGISMNSGDYCRAEPDSIHNESFTENGCLLLVCSSQLNEVLS